MRRTVDRRTPNATCLYGIGKPAPYRYETVPTSSLAARTLSIDVPGHVDAGRRSQAKKGNTHEKLPADMDPDRTLADRQLECVHCGPGRRTSRRRLSRRSRAVLVTRSYAAPGFAVSDANGNWRRCCRESLYLRLPERHG